jgi:hypothetical protein
MEMLYQAGGLFIIIAIAAIGFTVYLLVFGLFAQYVAFLDARKEYYAFVAFVAGAPFLLMELPA